MTDLRRPALVPALILALCAGLASAAETELIVSTAVSLKEPLQRAIDLYIDGGPDDRSVTIRVHAGGSTVLVQQILRGAPSDLFLAASPGETKQLVTAGLVLEGATCRLAGNELVVVVPVGRGMPGGPHDLVDPRFERIAVASPRTAPLGRYTRQALKALNLQEPLESKLIPAEHARQALDYVTRGEVDAAIVYRSDAQRFADRVSLAFAIDSDLHERIVYEVIVLAETRQPRESNRLFEFLCSAAGRAAFVESGLLPWSGRR